MPYPLLMAGKTIMYVHGFASSAQSGTAGRLRTMLPAANVIAEDLPLHPAEAMDLLRRLCDTHHPDLIIGTSMGGMYTEQLYGYDRIVVNPAFQIADTMASHGMSEQRRVWGLFGDEDDLVDTFDLFCSHYPQAAHFHGGHRMNDHIFIHNLLPLIRRIDDLQAHRERPVIFIGIETLVDSHGAATASAQKAFLQLQENYQVYIVAPSPTNHPSYPEEVIRQAVAYYDSPAHDRVIFTNQRHLLYGDFLVADAPCDDFLGTTIEWRSSDFKTWEEIIVYFERLIG